MPGTVITLPTIVVIFRQRLDLIGHGFNSLIELPPVPSKVSGDAYHAWRKNIRSLGQNVGQLLAKETQSLPDDDSALQKKATDLIDYCGSLADKARPHSVQRLQVQLLVGFGWNEAGRSGRCTASATA